MLVLYIDNLFNFIKYSTRILLTDVQLMSNTYNNVCIPIIILLN